MHRLPLFATAFRIFFLACALHAVAAITLWLLKLRGMDIAPTNSAGVYWHTYEMVFGFSRAAIFGFLFTAGQHWSGRFLLGGASALALFLLWFAGRFAFFLPPILAHAAFAADLAASMFALWRLRPLLSPAQRHNHAVVYLFTAYLLAQVFAIGAVHVPALQENFLHGVRLGLITVVILIAVIAGRILPFFASVVVQGEKPRIVPRIERFVWPSALTALASFALLPLHPVIEKVTAVIFLAMAVLHAVRWFYWAPFASLAIPILAILYAGYFWLVMGFAMVAASLIGLLPASPAWHMFGIGATGVFVFGMLTRVALGHTGRPIKAVPLILAAYLALNLALMSRVVLPLFDFTDRGYLIAAVLWVVSFVLYLLKYTAILAQPRIDGKPG